MRFCSSRRQGSSKAFFDSSGVRAMQRLAQSNENARRRSPRHRRGWPAAALRMGGPRRFSTCARCAGGLLYRDAEACLICFSSAPPWLEISRLNRRSARFCCQRVATFGCEATRRLKEMHDTQGRALIGHGTPWTVCSSCVRPEVVFMRSKAHANQRLGVALAKWSCSRAPFGQRARCLKLCAA